MNLRLSALFCMLITSFINNVIANTSHPQLVPVKVSNKDHSSKQVCVRSQKDQWLVDRVRRTQ